jgi:hypothetical protein
MAKARTVSLSMRGSRYSKLMSVSSQNGKPVKPSTTSTKAVPAKASTSAFTKPAPVTKPTATEAAKGKGKAKATKQDDDEPMLKPGKVGRKTVDSSKKGRILTGILVFLHVFLQLSTRNSKRVIRSETPEEEEPVKPKQVAVQKPVAVSMVSQIRILSPARPTLTGLLSFSSQTTRPPSLCRTLMLERKIDSPWKP